MARKARKLVAAAALGAGGDIFVAAGGSLIIEGGLLSGGSTLDSDGGTGAIGGAAIGDGIFLQSGNITLSATSANPLMVNDPITDQKGAAAPALPASTSRVPAL